MDPVATLAIVRDTDATELERCEAAVNLLVWFAKGGYHWTHRETAHKVIDECDAILQGMALMTMEAVQ